MTAKHNADRRVPAGSREGWVPIPLMRVDEYAQRPLDMPWVKGHAADFDPEKLGVLVVSKRPDGFFYIIDGQHRRALLDEVGWGDQQARCEIYDGLTIQQEAEMFLGRNDRRSVTPLAKHKVSVTAGRPEAVAIDRIVTRAGLKVGSGAGYVQAVGTLYKVYRAYGADVLNRALVIIRDSFGPKGLDAPIIEAVAMMLYRYGDDFRDENAVAKFSAHKGGIGDVMTTARQLVHTLAYPRPQCVAAALVDVYNKKPMPKGSKFLPSWFKTGADAAGA